MRRPQSRLVPLLALLAIPACAGPPHLDAGRVDATTATASRGALNEPLATRRGGSVRVLAAGGGRGCGRSALDDPAAAQRLMAATYAEGPRDAEAPVFACGPVFRAL